MGIEGMDVLSLLFIQAIEGRKWVRFLPPQRLSSTSKDEHVSSTFGCR